MEFDPHGGGVNEVSAILPGATVSGQADFLGEHFVALYACDGQFFLRAGTGVVNLHDARLQLEHEHLAGGETRFRAADSKARFEIVYPSWWVGYPAVLLMHQDTDDADEDFCAYVVDLIRDPEVVQRFLDEYSG
ncbi:hypothetical protein KDH83_27145 [Achromobacter sp. Marseille-Q0513]|uniref:hypothetical protein n=1 Tax=Achromobacter sp. Marseille-Q0513 TaxID=2829161 RepID=UPI001B9EF8A0|nr:hypothetical protein [Achromobacter sp. Marseille-Q0513]MBR8656999.1 hypothetical protein [Achromobacter sp. Marseille-Q0513]